MKRENEDKNKKEHGVISVSLFMSTVSPSQRKNTHNPSGAVKIKLLPLLPNIFDIKLVKYISKELKNRIGEIKLILKAYPISHLGLQTIIIQYATVTYILTINGNQITINKCMS